MKAWFTRRCVTLHLLAVFLVAVMLGLGYWQWQRAGQGNARSAGYAIEWPLFAAFICFMWWKMIREELREGSSAESAGPGQAVARRPGVPASMRIPAAPVLIDDGDDPELAAYNRRLARLNDEAQRRTT